MEKFAIIVAAGSGLRMGSELPKQFLPLKEKPVLFYTLETFLGAYDDLQVILVLPLDHIPIGQEIIDASFDRDRVRITAGGDTRFQSVKNGLALVDCESIVFVHDGVRCLVSKELVHRCFEKAVETGTAIPVIPCRDSIRMITEEGNESIDREKVMLVQTPQTFHSRILIPAYQIDYKDRFTDEATVAEAFCIKLSLVAGEETNIKITTPGDLIMAEKVLEGRIAPGSS